MIATAVRPDTYQKTLEAAHRINWRIQDIIGPEKRLDFDRPFLPETLAGVEPVTCLNAHEKLLLNQIRGNSYLYLFGVVEEFIVPLVLDHVRQLGTENIVATQAFLCFAEEEGKHIELFRRFAQEFQAGFGTPCACIGPAQAIAEAVLAHSPLGVALAVLHIEWMTQRHYLESVKDNQDLDPQFASLLKHHWLEEAQHARLDEMMIASMAEHLPAAAIARGFDDYLAIGAFLDSGFANQVQLDIESLQTATGRLFSAAEREEIGRAQQQAYRYTFLVSGMTHPNFVANLQALSPVDAERVASLAANLA